jgi:hypothetical protein
MTAASARRGNIPDQIVVQRSLLPVVCTSTIGLSPNSDRSSPRPSCHAQRGDEVGRQLETVLMVLNPVSVKVTT